jgi:HEAT repeat protein
MRHALVALVIACAACQGTPKDPAGWARAAVRRNRVQEKVEAVEQARKAPGDKKAAVPDLILLLKDAPKVRAAAAVALGEFQDPSAVAPLVAAVDLAGGGDRPAETNDANRQIATALGALHAREAVPVLAKLTRSRDGFTQVAAVDALGDVGDPAGVDALLGVASDPETEPFTVKKTLLALGKIGDPRAGPAILQMLFRERRGASFFPEAAFAAYEIGPPMAGPLLAVLRGEDAELLAWARANGVVEGALYAKAAQVLGDLGDARAVAALLQRLSYVDRMAEAQVLVRVYAAESLGRLRAREAVKPIGEMLLREKDPDLRDRYCDALVRVGDPAALPVLARAAQGGSWEARSGALAALSQLGGDAEARTVEAARRSDAAHAAELGLMAARLAAARECREDLACWTRKLSDPQAAVRDRAALEVGRRGGSAQAAALTSAAGLPVETDADLAARWHALLALDWVTTRGAPGALVLAGQLDDLADRERNRNFTAKVNEDAKRLAVRLRRQSRG